ncbi:MAG: hypothetical protein ABSB61_09140 [Anaerolineales bacterium]|jgi:hypothetical protein
MFARIAFRVVASVVLVLLLLAAAGGIYWVAYHAGLAQGVQEGRSLTGGAAPAPIYTYGPYWFPPFGWGLGLLGCLVPLVFLFFVFSLVRLLVWGGGRRHGHRGYGGPGFYGHEGGPGHWHEMAEEWHRRQHGKDAGSASRSEGQSL